MAELRDRLRGELNELVSTDDAAIWAQRCPPEKNRLTATDAHTSRKLSEHALQSSRRLRSMPWTRL